MSDAPARRRLGSIAWLMAFVCALPLPRIASADTVIQSSNFSFTHSGYVTTGLVSVGGTFSRSETTTAPGLTFPRFNAALGQLTDVNVTVTTSSSSFLANSTGLLSLVTSRTITRTLAYDIASGTATGGDSAQVTDTGPTLLTLLSLGPAQIGGASLAKSTHFTSASDLAQFSGAGSVTVTLSATDAFSVTAGISLFNGAGTAGSGTAAGSVSVTYTYTPYVTLSGSVYLDGNHSGFRDSNEAGTGLTLYAKVLADATPAGPALQAVAVNPSTGQYSMQVTRGTYRIVIDDNATLVDVAPLSVPSGWSAVQANTLIRSAVVVAADTGGQDFGLIHSTSLNGRVFKDDGAGAGTPNDGTANGGEAGLAGVTLQLLDAGNAVLDSTVSRGDGTYTLFVPSTVLNGATLRVQQTNLPSWMSTGASLGNSGGSYSRATDIISLTFASGTNYSGLDFGDVPVPSLGNDGIQSGTPSATLLYSHQFVATSAGQVTFSMSHVPVPNIAGWSEVIYLDTNQNGTPDAGEPVMISPIAVSAGQRVFLIVKVVIPAAAPFNSRMQSTLRADMSFTNATPALAQALTVTQSTDVLATSDAAMSLRKSVDKVSAAPGDTLVYTIIFTNTGASTLANVVINDTTPSYTTFVSASLVSTPSALGSPAVVSPAVGAKGALRWTFPGSLVPEGSGTLQFVVKVEQ